MGRRSTISRLPKEIREKIADLRTNGNKTIDEIMEHLALLDVDVSRSALGRHLKKQEQVVAQIMRSRTLAEAVAKQFGDKETGKVARVNMELLHTLLMKVMVGEGDGEVVLDAKEAMFVATALEKLTKATKIDQDRELKIRDEERKAATIEAAKVVSKEAKKQGLSSEVIDAIKSQILGVKK